MTKKLLILFAALLLCACVKVGYGYVEGSEAEIPGFSKVTWKVNWNGDEAFDRMVVGMTKIIKSEHFSDTVYREEIPDTLIVADGDYYAVAFYADDVFDIEGYEDFCDNEDVSLAALYATLHKVEASEITERFPEIIADVYSTTSLENAGSAYCAFTKRSINTGAKPTVVEFKPIDLTAEITFKIEVELDEGVSVEAIVGEIIGIPGRVSLMSGIVDDKNLSRVYFDMEQTGATSHGARFEGRISSLGAFASRESGNVTGHGVLRITLKATVPSDDPDAPRTRIFHAGVNLGKLIEDSKIMNMTEDMAGYRLAKNSVTYVVDDVLHVSRDKVMSIGKDAITKWEPIIINEDWSDPDYEI